jgi:hypothetical protein
MMDTLVREQITVCAPAAVGRRPARRETSRPTGREMSSGNMNMYCPYGGARSAPINKGTLLQLMHSR